MDEFEARLAVRYRQKNAEAAVLAGVHAAINQKPVPAHASAAPAQSVGKSPVVTASPLARLKPSVPTNQPVQRDVGAEIKERQRQRRLEE
eukprot:5827186-Pleurochrysis_carterae.AAC.1